ncbi:MAG: 3-dehydroquinate synthase [Chloroflexi bacterium]|nr:3-dehydroquinate synthase [Chloroflexota bacterium]
MPDNIILIGFSGTGKSIVGRDLARRLGRPYADSDDELVGYFGKSIARVFAEDGEVAFRAAERRIVAELCGRMGWVLSLGGGAVVDPTNRARVIDLNRVIRLEASPETILDRLRGDPGTEVRPMLAVADPLARIRHLRASRAEAYAIAHVVVDTERKTPLEVVNEIVQHFTEGSGSSQMSKLIIGYGILPRLGAALVNAGLTGRAFVFTDEVVARHHLDATRHSLDAAGLTSDACILPSGEPTKSLAQAFQSYDWLIDRQAERTDVILALGGGVVGDLAGFVAATYLRGIPFVQVPTTLLAQIDSSIGGKAAVNHPRGKNLVGAFYPARLVFSDVALVATLPRREIVNGWTEAIKHALLFDPGLLATMEQHADALVAVEPSLTAEVVERAAQHKVRIVAEDERESGPRIVLNYGHTIAHALETATAYEGVLHGEAVAIGMAGAAEIAVQLGVLDQATAERQNAILRRFGLPTRAGGFLSAPPSTDAVVAGIRLDKKVRASRVRWVFLEAVGRTRVEADVPADLVRQVIDNLLAQ